MFENALLVILGVFITRFYLACKEEYKKQKQETVLKKDFKEAAARSGAVTINEMRETWTKLPDVVSYHPLYDIQGNLFVLYMMSDGTTQWQLPEHIGERT